MASVTYKIGGKYDAKAAKDARKGIQNLGSAAKTVNLAFKAFIGSKVIGGLTKSIDGSIASFQEANAASSKLLKSVSNDTKITAGAFDRLSQKAKSLQKTSIFSDEEIKTQQAFLANLNLTEDQINSVMQTSMDMAASGVMPLNSAVKNLAKTYSGTAGELGEMSGQIKALTKDQLKNGDAVKLLAEQYKGYASAMADTFGGKDSQFNNGLSDMKEAFGAIGASLKFLGEDAAMPWMDKITNWLTENRDRIINFVIHFPDVMKEVGSGIVSMLPKLFTLDFFIRFFEAIGKAAITIAKNALMTLWSVIKAVATTIWEPLKTGLEYCGYGLKLAWTNIVNGLLSLVESMANWIIDKVNSLVDFLPDWITEKLGISGMSKVEIQLLAPPEKPKSIDTQAMKDAWTGVGESLLDGLDGITDALSSAGGEITSLLKEKVGPEAETMLKRIEEILDKPLPPKLQKALLSSVKGSGQGQSTENTGVLDGVSAAMGGLKGIIGMFGELGTAITALMSGNPIGLIVQVITSFVGALSGIENFGKVINFLGTIFGKMAEVLDPIVNDALAPLVVVLEDIGTLVGQLLAPVFKILGLILQPICTLIHTIFQVISPFLDLFGMLATLFVQLNPMMVIFTAGLKLLAQAIAWVFNKVVRPIVNFVIELVTGFANFLIGIWNKIVDVFNWIQVPTGISISWRHGIDVDWSGLGSLIGVKKKSYIDSDNYTLDEISVSDGTTTDSTTSSSSGASYSAASDVYVNIYFNNSYVNGDAREIALSLRNEIRAAEKLGY